MVGWARACENAGKYWSALSGRCRRGATSCASSPSAGANPDKSLISFMPTGEQEINLSPVAFNDIKHLTRSMPADGLEAQDVVVPPRCGWVAHKPSICRHFHMRGPANHLNSP